MHRWWIRLAAIIAAVVGVVGICVFGVQQLVKAGVELGPAIQAVAGSLAALVGAVSAVAAWIAARNSSRAAADSVIAAREAREALGRIVKPNLNPHIEVEEDRHGHSRRTLGNLTNSARIAAIDVDVEWYLRDKRIIRGTTARLEADATNGVDLGQTQDGALAHEIVEQVIIRYSDERGLLRWETTCHPRASIGPYTDWSPTERVLPR